MSPSNLIRFRYFASKLVKFISIVHMSFNRSYMNIRQKPNLELRGTPAYTALQGHKHKNHKSGLAFDREILKPSCKGGRFSDQAVLEDNLGNARRFNTKDPTSDSYSYFHACTREQFKPEDDRGQANSQHRKIELHRLILHVMGYRKKLATLSQYSNILKPAYRKNSEAFDPRIHTKKHEKTSAREYSIAFIVFKDSNRTITDLIKKEKLFKKRRIGPHCFQTFG